MTLIPAGFYKAVAVSIVTPDGETYVQFGESSTGKPQAVINFEIIEGLEAGRRIAWFGYFTEKTVQRTVESLRYCGFTGNDLAAAVTQQLDQEVQIVVAHEEYQGKVSARVNWVNRAGGDGFRLEKPMAGIALSRFAAQMKGSVGAVPESPGKKGERGQKPTATADAGAGGGQAAASNDFAQRPPADDEIPF